MIPMHAGGRTATLGRGEDARRFAGSGQDSYGGVEPACSCSRRHRKCTLDRSSVRFYIARRTAFGHQWTPAALALVTAVALADTDLYAGLEDGRILQMKDGAWVVAGQAPGAAHVTTLAKLSSGEWWLVNARKAWTGKQTVMNADSSKSLTGIAETPTKTLVQPGPDFFFGRAVKAPVTAFAGTSRGFLLRPEFESLVYDASTATWGGPRLKKDAPSFRANNDGTVLFSMRPGRLSVDGGASWSASRATRHSGRARIFQRA